MVCDESHGHDDLLCPCYLEGLEAGQEGAFELILRVWKAEHPSECACESCLVIRTIESGNRE